MIINLQDLFKEACQEFLPDFKKKAKEHFRKFFDNQLDKFFFTRQQRQRFKDNPNLYRHCGIDPNDKDLGMANDIIENFIAENILDEKYIEYMKDYAEKNFQKHLDAAMDKAMQHKANAMAFKHIKEKE